MLSSLHGHLVYISLVSLSLASSRMHVKSQCIPWHGGMSFCYVACSFTLGNCSLIAGFEADTADTDWAESAYSRGMKGGGQAEDGALVG
jgi:hypothetical protein